MRRSNCASALQYVPELTWILFLRILDAQDWAAPLKSDSQARTPECQPVGWKRDELKAKIGDLFAFINKDLLPHLHSPKQRVIGRIMLVLHGIDQPNLWHGNTLSGAPTYDALFEQAPATFDVILTNPSFGGKEGKEAQKN